MRFDAFDTPIGILTIAADDSGLRHILFASNDHSVVVREHWQRDVGALREPREQLLAYFHGQRRTFELQIAPHGTPFQMQVWHTLALIPFGATWSYAQLAARVGNAKAMRAVGAANGRNPLPIVLPCHRVIGADGRLIGFGGGLPNKRWLLEHEGALPARLAV